MIFCCIDCDFLPIPGGAVGIIPGGLVIDGVGARVGGAVCTGTGATAGGGVDRGAEITKNDQKVEHPTTTHTSHILTHSRVTRHCFPRWPSVILSKLSCLTAVASASCRICQLLHLLAVVSVSCRICQLSYLTAVVNVSGRICHLSYL